MKKENIENFWSKNYKILMWIPIILFILSIILIGIKISKTGDFINKDVTLRGGIAATVYTQQEFSEEEIKAALQADSNIKKLGDIRTGKQIGFIIEVSDINEEQLREMLTKELALELTHENFSVEETSPKLSQAFFKQLMIAIIFAFILMGLAVFIAFRTPIPSIAVISAALMDVTITLAIVNIIGMDISTAGIVGFLLIIGYSVDTDILLTTWAIKKRDFKLFDRMMHSAKTGLTMTFTAIAVMIIGVIFTNSVVIKEMFTIILIALSIDILTTYLTNAGILWIYCKKKRIE